MVKKIAFQFGIAVIFSVLIGSGVSTWAAPCYHTQERDEFVDVHDQTSQEAPEGFRAALRAAQENLKSAGGESYEEAFRRSANQWLPDETADCAEGLSKADFSAFVVLVQVGSSGKAERVLVWPETKLALCLSPAFLAADNPQPPGQSWWVRMGVEIRMAGEGEAKADSQFKVPEGGGIVYGSEIGVMVGAPKGWIFDSEGGVSQGLHCVMYPLGSSWKEAGEVMYVSIAQLEPGQTLAGFIGHDVENFKEKSPALKIESLESISVLPGILAQVRSFAGDQYGNFECIAYAQFKNSVAVYVLTCRNRKGYEKSLDAFKEMVSKSVLVVMSLKDKARK